MDSTCKSASVIAESFRTETMTCGEGISLAVIAAIPTF